MTRILVLNTLSQKGLEVFSSKYIVGKDVENPEGILVRSAQVITNDYKHLIAVGRAGAGTNTITVPQATHAGICVFNTPGANANAVAELVYFMIGLRARNIYSALNFARTLVREADIPTLVEQGKSQFTGFELRGKKIGVIGLGKIGVLVANKGIENGMSVIAYEPSPSAVNMHQLNPTVTIVHQLEELLSQVDIITIHVPLMESTRDLITKKQLVLMKAGCILVNFSREEICHEQDVISSLDNGKLDTYITDFPTKKLLTHPKVICTPHLGASTLESEENCAIMVAGQLRDYFEYGIVNNSVNFPTIRSYPHTTTITRLIVINNDIPNMIANIASVLGTHNINIQAMVNESNGTIGYNLVDLEVEISDECVNLIRQLPHVLKVRVIKFSS